MKRDVLVKKLAALHQSKTDVLTKLRAVHELESVVEDRMRDGLQPVLDEASNPLTPDYISQRIEGLACELMESSAYNPLLVSVMDGALPFATELHNVLLRHYYRFQYATMQVSSYVGTVAGVLTINSPPKISVGGRDVIIVDDVCDTGKTALAIAELLLAQGALSVKLMVLVNKEQLRSCPEANPHFVGVTVSKDAFIAGMGMDYEGLLRNVPGVWAVDLATLPNEAEKVLLKSKKPLNLQLQETLAEISVVERQLQQEVVSAAQHRDAMFSRSVRPTTLAARLSSRARRAEDDADEGGLTAKRMAMGSKMN